MLGWGEGCGESPQEKQDAASKPTRSSLLTQPGPFSQAARFCSSGYIRNYLSFGPKTKKNVDLFPGLLNYTERTLPQRGRLSGVRAVLGRPAPVTSNEDNDQEA